MSAITSSIRQSIRTSIRSSFGGTLDQLQALITSLFSNGEQGAIYIPRPIVNGEQALFQDSAGTVPVTADGDPDGLMIDQSPNSINAAQSVSSQRPTYNANPDRLSLDKVDDALTITVPTGGWTGTMVLATDQGTASYGISIPAGAYELGGQFFPGGAIVGALFRNEAITAGEKTDAESYFVGNGATASYGTVLSFSGFWRLRSEITSFPLIDTSSGTDFFATWFLCTSLTSVPLIDTSNGTIFSSTWRNCSSLTSFPLIDMSSGTVFNRTWRDCILLASFPANAFDNVKGGDFAFSFDGTNLNESSIDGILVSLVTSGIATGTRVFDQSGGSAPSVGTGQPAIDTLRARGWTVTVTGGY